MHDNAIEIDEMYFYMFRSGINQNIMLNDVEVFYSDTHETFDEFDSHAFDIWKISLLKETAKWQLVQHTIDILHVM